MADPVLPKGPAPVILRSGLFRTSPRLQWAALSHAFHVQKGSRGEHVLRIQTFLIFTGVLRDFQSQGSDEESFGVGSALSTEMNGPIYGPTTAVLVQFMKMQNGIVGSWQTQADDIVGVNTIRFMDSTQLSSESQGTGPDVATRMDRASSAPNFLKPTIVAGLFNCDAASGRLG